MNSFFHEKNGEANKTPKILEDFNKNTKNKKGHSRYFITIKNSLGTAYNRLIFVEKKIQKIVLKKCFV